MNVQKKALIFTTLILVLLLSACGSNQTKETVAETRTYSGVSGEVQLPADPERVVVIDQDYVGDVLALGVTPVGAGGWVFETPYYSELLNEVENIGDKTSTSVESVTMLNPDTIITYDDTLTEQLSQIAPTVLIPYGTYDYRERLIEIGKILNKEEKAQEVLAEFDKKVAEKKDELFKQVDPGLKVVIIEASDKEIFLYGKSFGRGGEIFYNLFGLHATDKVEEAAFEQGWARISLEAIPEYLGEADHILWCSR